MKVNTDIHFQILGKNECKLRRTNSFNRGRFFSGLGYGKQSERKKLLSRGIKAEGRVIELILNRSHNSADTYSPVIKFETVDKECVVQEYDINGTSEKYRMGDNVTVIYEAGNARHFIVDNKSTRLLGPVFISVGLALIAGVIVYFFINQYPDL